MPGLSILLARERAPAGPALPAASANDPAADVRLHRWGVLVRNRGLALAPRRRRITADPELRQLPRHHPEEPRIIVVAPGHKLVETVGGAHARCTSMTMGPFDFSSCTRNCFGAASSSPATAMKPFP